MPRLDPASVLGPHGAIARRLPNYEHRPEQLAMSEAVARAMADGHHVMVEAGTGVGKSFAYLVPAILAATEHKRKVVVSTHTISLQEQLLQKDLPFLRAVMPQEFTAVLVKGRSNYVSLRRLDAAVVRAGATFASFEEHEDLARLRDWASKTQDGSRSDLEFRPAPSVWDAVASDHGNCLGRGCPRHRDCFYYRERRRMWSANLLVVNHALFLSDLALRSQGAGFLPPYDIVIFDEAHTLEAVAGEHLGLRVTSAQLDYTLTRLYNERTGKGLLVYHRLHEAMEQARRTRLAAQGFFDAVVVWQRRHGSANGRLRQPLQAPHSPVEDLRKLATAIGDASRSVPQDEQRIELTAAADRCDALAIALEQWLDQAAPESVYWIEVQEGSRRRVTLASAPLDVGPILRRELFDPVPSCILTSATLSVGTPPTFAFARSRLGLHTGETLQLGSPFDYERQAAVHITGNLPDPSQQPADYEREAIRAIPYYVEKTGGKAFVLFTSYRMMDEAARVLGPWFAERKITLLVQSEGLPRSKMVQTFMSDVHSVLFGADSFWQGVDVPGEALSNVIIVRLPFSVPDHPLLEARLEEIRRRGGNPFVEYQVPEAVLKLKQGFGRLIRTRTDRGIVVILDPRIVTKGYGRTFLSSLPACPKIVDTLGATGIGKSGRRLPP